MKLKNVLIAVKDMERAVSFYKELFGLQVVLDQGGNVILTEGLVLQDAALWAESLGREIVSENNGAELYFEELDLEGFARKLEAYREPVRWVTPLEADGAGRKLIRFYDPDGNLIEVREPAGRQIL